MYSTAYVYVLAINLILIKLHVANDVGAHVAGERSCCSSNPVLPDSIRAPQLVGGLACVYLSALALLHNIATEKKK